MSNSFVMNILQALTLCRLLNTNILLPKYPPGGGGAPADSGERSNPMEPRLRRCWTPPRQLPQHILQNPAVLVVQNLLRRIDPDHRAKLSRLAQIRLGKHRDRLPVGELGIEHRLQLTTLAHSKDLLARQMQRLHILPRQKLQWQNPHSHQV